MPSANTLTLGEITRSGTRAVPEGDWLGVSPDPMAEAAFAAQLPALLDDEAVVASLVDRGMMPDLTREAAAADLRRLAHAFTVLTTADRSSVLSSVLPARLLPLISRIDARIDHVGREVAAPVLPLVAAWRRATDILDLEHLPQRRDSATAEGDLVFPSVQVVKTLRRDDPNVQAVTIGRSFVRPDAGAAALSIELFYVGEVHGGAAQHLSAMDRRIDGLSHAPFRLTAPRPPICHLSLEVADRASLCHIHEIGQRDRSGLVFPYDDEVSVNPGDGSHNTKLAVRRRRTPSAPVNVLEFAFFD
jgi:hypothetical protein